MSHLSIGAKKLALSTILGLSFIVFFGMWPGGMISLYPCRIAVVFCFVSGTLIGTWVADNSIVSAIIRPKMIHCKQCHYL